MTSRYIPRSAFLTRAPLRFVRGAAAFIPTKAARMAAMACLTLWLSGCDGMIAFMKRDCEVYVAGSEPEHGSFVLSGKSQTVNTGMRVKAGDEIIISVKGTIDLCPGGASVGPQNASFPLKATTAEWQESPFPVKKDGPFTLKAEGSYSDLTGKKDKGVGLYVLIASEEYFQANKAKLNEKMFYASPAYGDDHTRFGGKEEFEFFELSQAGSKDGKATIFFPDEKGARLYFRYARNAEARGVSDLGESSMRFTPWDGDYKWSKRCQDCMAAGFTDNALCQAYKVGGPNCAAGNHWANGDYKLNGDGYTVNYSSNCVVHDGQGLFVSFSDSAQDTEPLMEFKVSGTRKVDCTKGDKKNCTEARDENGNIRFKHEPDGDPFIPGQKFMNAEVDQGGSLSTPVKATKGGFLRFSLKDDKQKVSDLYSEGGCSATAESVKPKCCFINPWPKEPLFKTLNDAACGPITGGTNVCQEFNDSCIPAAGYTGYADNLGEYRISVTLSKKPKIVRFLRPISEAVHGIFFGTCSSGEVNISSSADCKGKWTPGVTQSIFQNFVKDTGFHTLLRALFALVIVFYGYLIMIGGTSNPTKDSIFHLFRIGFVAILLDPDAWLILDQYIFSFFIKGSESFMMMIQNGILDNFYDLTGALPPANAAIENLPDPTKTGDFLPLSVEDPFDFFYYLYYWIFTHDNFRRFLAYSLWKFPLGIGVFLFLFFEILEYFFQILRLFVVYILSKMLIAFLALISPVFFIFILFKKTREYFEKWVFMCAQYMLQPVAAIVTLAVFTLILFSLLKKIISVEYCYDCIIPAIPVFPFILIPFPCLLTAFQPHADIGGVFFIIFIILMILDTCNKITEWMMKAIGSIFVGMGQLGIEREAYSSLNGLTHIAFSAASAVGTRGATAAKSLGSSAVKAASKAASKAPRGGLNLPGKK